MIEIIVNKINKTNASFIFAGAKGVGKRHTALQIVKAILGESERIEKDIHPNVITIRPENKEIKIDRIREVIRSLVFSPAEGSKRFIIIEEAHRMNQSSSNALLKTLEEPPENTVFFLISSNLHSMLPTIISRCEIVRFPPLSDGELMSILDLPSNHPFIPYAMGSISNLNFYIANEPEITKLINFLKKPRASYQHISSLVGEIIDITSGSIEALEYVMSLIINVLIKKTQNMVEENVNVDRTLSRIKNIEDMSQKIYLNTSPSIVIENMLLEATMLNI